MATVDALLAVASGAWPTAREIRRAFGDVAVERRAYTSSTRKCNTAQVGSHFLGDMRVRMERRLGMPARVFCDRLSRTLLTIGKTACAMRPSGSSAMVKEVAGWAEHYTKVGFDVVLVGHSYGGSVVAACAEGMKRRNPRLHMVTLGSIYVPGPSRTPYADIRHVVNVGDIAMKCNGLDPGRDGAFVEFRETDAGARPSLRKRWALHRAYSVDDAVRGVVGALT